MRQRALVLALTAAFAASVFATPATASTTSSTAGSLSTPAPARCLNWHLDGWVTRLRGDIDGDGVVDTARTQARWVGQDTCRARLVVRTARGTTHIAIPAFQGLLMKPPGLAGLVSVGPGQRLDIAVIVLLGANTVWLDLYALQSGRLHQVNRTVLGYGGGIAYLFGTDCARHHGARLVSTRAVYDWKANRYAVRRSFFGVRGGQLVRIPRLTERYVVPPRRLFQFPELNAGRPFPSCTVVRGVS
ncbi:MAG: hypothetical protein WAN48_05470 [Actinomycetes bacterium]